jgi:hypothetical protein
LFALGVRPPSLERVNATLPIQARKLVSVRPGLPLDEISLVHGVPPWEIETNRQRPRLWRRAGWRLRAIGYRVGLRRLALAGLSDARTE